MALSGFLKRRGYNVKYILIAAKSFGSAFVVGYLRGVLIAILGFTIGYLIGKLALR